MNDITPKTYDEFLELTAEGTVVPVVKRVMADLLTPVAAYLKLERLSAYSFLLESIEGGEKVARYSFLGFDPEIIVRSRAGKVTIEKSGTTEEIDQPMLNCASAALGTAHPGQVSGLASVCLRRGRLLELRRGAMVRDEFPIHTRTISELTTR